MMFPTPPTPRPRVLSFRRVLVLDPVLAFRLVLSFRPAPASCLALAFHLAFLFPVGLAPAQGPSADSPVLKIEREGDRYRLSVASDGRDVLRAPPEGLWSIAFDWKDGWPSGWRHGDPVRCEIDGDWTILGGRIEGPGGAWEIRDAYRVERKAAGGKAAGAGETAGGEAADVEGEGVKAGGVTGPDVKGAHAKDTDLKETDVRRTDRQATDIKGAQVTGAHLKAGGVKGAESTRIRGLRRWTWRGAETSPRTTLSVRFQVPGAAAAQVVLPGILYNGNPSGARSGRVPVYGGKPGEEALFEEHRYPLPFATVEFDSGGGAETPDKLDTAGRLDTTVEPVTVGSRRGAALHSLPSLVPYGHLPDQWWSLGVAGIDRGQELLLLSGPCASNGRRSVIKAIQPGFLPYDDAWLEAPPGTVIEKTFFIEAFPVDAEGSGFSTPLHTSLALFAPFDEARFPRIRDILLSKLAYARSRWIERGSAEGGSADTGPADSGPGDRGPAVEAPAAGFSKYPDRPFFVMGWCGQADAPGYALQVLGGYLGEPRATDWAQRSLDFLSQSPFYERGFHTWYDVEKGQWTGDEVLSQGQALLSFARAIRMGRGCGAATARWEEFFRKACDLHAARILKDGWRPASTNEAFLIAPLCEGSRLFGDGASQGRFWRAAAVKAGVHYAGRHVSMKEPYWGGTLDASCEDKEGAYAAFQGFLALHELTGEARFLAWARHACDAVLSYLVVWDIDMPPGRLRDHAFRTTGWTVVSPQNQHVDVYGVTMVPDIWRLGELTGDDALKRIALVMYRSCGQLIDPHGSQGEQPQHTNYTQAGAARDPRHLRGGYNETWTVFWITAHFLTAAARLQEMGIDLDAH